MNRLKTFAITALAAVALSSCTLNSRMMREPNAHVEFRKDDFTFSGQVSGEASVTKILGIDFERLFIKNVGNGGAGQYASLPVIGPMLDQLFGDRAIAYAMYDLLEKNKGYDVIVYPVVETKKSGIPILYTTTNAKVTARLGKIK